MRNLDGKVAVVTGGAFGVGSEILLNQTWVLSPDGSQRILIATKENAPLDNNPSLVLRGDVLCTREPRFSARET